MQNTDMKKILYTAIAAAAVFTACTKDGNTPVQKDDQVPGEITISATLSDALTKVSFTPAYDTNGLPSAMGLTWADGDKLRVYNHADKTQYSDFDLDASCIGQKAGTFKGTPVSASSWDVEIINGAVDYGTQTQPGDGETGNLKYLASESGVTDLSALTFTEFSSILAITAKMPSSEVAAVIKSIDITASEAIFATGNTLTITLDSVGDAGSDGILYLFANLPQGNTAISDGTTLLIHFNAPGEAHEVYTRFVELDAQTFTANKLNTISVNAASSDKVANGSAAGIGTAANPYLIGDKYQMASVKGLMADGVTKYFKLIDDIDMTGITWDMLNNASGYAQLIDFNGNSKTVSNLGGTMFYVFKGDIYDLTLDGSTVSSGSHRSVFAQYIQGTGHTVTNVDIRNVSDFPAKGNCGAMAGRINSGTSGVTSVVFTDCDITDVNVNGTTATGGFIGSIEAQVEINNCTVTGGAVTNTSSTGTGGFIGKSSAPITVTKCSTSASVSSADNNVGGFIGNFGGAGTITKCFATGTVTNTGDSKQSCGGFVGNMNSAGDKEIAECYATGDYTPSGNGAGGFAGKIEGGQTSNYSIHDCYASGNVTKNVNWCGSFVGQIQKSAGKVTFTDCYATGTNWAGYGYRHGGFAGGIDAAITTIETCAAWSSQVKGQPGVGNWSAGAVVGVAFPICTLTDNYRKPGMTLHAYWGNSGQTQTLTDSFQHENVSSTNPLWTYDSAGNFVQTTKTTLDYSDGSAIFAYQGKCVADKTLSELASSASYLNWAASVWDFTQELPRLKWTLE